MPLTPQITLTFTLLDYSGAQLGSAANPAYLRIALCNFGSNLPRVPGTAMIAKTTSWFVEIPYLGTAGSIQLWGNDVISPAGTYYQISVLDTNKNVIQTNLYIFTGMTTVDLSIADPLNPPPTPPPPIPPGNYFADEIVPNGTINSTDGVTGNAIFTLPNTPSPAGSLNLFKNGQRMTRGVAFSLTGATITYASGYLPIAGADSHICFYRYAV